MKEAFFSRRKERKKERKKSVLSVQERKERRGGLFVQVLPPQQRKKERKNGGGGVKQVLDAAVGVHDVGEAEEGGDVGAGVEVAAEVVLVGGGGDVVVDGGAEVVDDLDEVGAGGVVDGGGADGGARRESGLEGGVGDAEFLEGADGRRRAGRVGGVDDETAAGVRERGRASVVDLVGLGRQKDDVDAAVLKQGRVGAEHVGGGVEVLGGGRREDVAADARAALAFDLRELVELVLVEARGLVDKSRRIAERDGNGATGE
mmetsp:Transcript_16722/g.50697  ORF Transcript_16722/g.50697 Transcript_16722/m.50697 type:complete len:260 (+) Transcript_16722:204-983(+)